MNPDGSRGVALILGLYFSASLLEEVTPLDRVFGFACCVIGHSLLRSGQFLDTP